MLAHGLMRNRLLQCGRGRLATEDGLRQQLRPEGFGQERLVPDIARERDGRLGVVDGLGQPFTQLEKTPRHALMGLSAHDFVGARLEDRL